MTTSVPNELKITINTSIPGFQSIKYKPYMTLPNDKNDSSVQFNPLVKLNPSIIQSLPSNIQVSEFFNKGLFQSLINSHGLVKAKTLVEATNAGYVDNNIKVTLETLFPSNSVIYINRQPYTIADVQWRKGDWKIDSKVQQLPELESSNITDPYLYRTIIKDEIISGENELQQIPKEIVYGANYTGPQNVASGIKPPAPDSTIPPNPPNPPPNPPNPPNPPSPNPFTPPEKPIKPIIPQNLQITGPSLELQEKENRLQMQENMIRQKQEELLQQQRLISQQLSQQQYQLSQQQKRILMEQEYNISRQRKKLLSEEQILLQQLSEIQKNLNVNNIKYPQLPAPPLPSPQLPPKPRQQIEDIATEDNEDNEPSSTYQIKLEYSKKTSSKLRQYFKNKDYYFMNNLIFQNMNEEQKKTVDNIFKETSGVDVQPSNNLSKSAYKKTIDNIRVN